MLLRLTLICVMALSGISAAHAQKGLEKLESARIFNNKIKGMEVLEESQVEGSDLDKFKMTLWKAVECKCTDEALDQITKIIMADAQKSTEKEVKKKAGKLVYCLFGFDNPKKDNTKCYFMFCLGKNNEIDCSYVETSATMKEMRGMLIIYSDMADNFSTDDPVGKMNFIQDSFQGLNQVVSEMTNFSYMNN